MQLAPLALEKSSESRFAQARVLSRRAMAGRLASTFTPVRLHASQHLPGDPLIEFVLRRRLSLRFVLAQGGALRLPERRRTGFHEARRRARFAQMAQDLAHGARVGDEGDDSHRAASVARRSMSSSGVSITLTLPPGSGEIDAPHAASKMDWSAIEPAILDTLLIK